MSDFEDALARIHREEYAAVVASLVRRFGDIDLAEDAASEALVVALEHWASAGSHRTPAAGSPPPRHARRSTGSAASRTAITSTGRQA